MSFVISSKRVWRFGKLPLLCFVELLVGFGEEEVLLHRRRCVWTPLTGGEKNLFLSSHKPVHSLFSWILVLGTGDSIGWVVGHQVMGRENQVDSALEIVCFWRHLPH